MAQAGTARAKSKAAKDVASTAAAKDRELERLQMQLADAQRKHAAAMDAREGTKFKAKREGTPRKQAERRAVTLRKQAGRRAVSSERAKSKSDTALEKAQAKYPVCASSRTTATSEPGRRRRRAAGCSASTRRTLR